MGRGKEKGKLGLENGIGIVFVNVLRAKEKERKITSYLQQT